MANKTEAFRSGFSIYTSRLITKLSEGNIGDKLTREQLAQVSGVSVEPGNKGYSALQSAIRYCERAVGKVWRWNRGEAVLECLDAEKSAGLVQQRVSVAHRHAGRTLRVAATVDRTKLSAEKTQAFDMSTLQAALVQRVASTSVGKKLGAMGDIHNLTAPSPDAIAGILTASNKRS